MPSNAFLPALALLALGISLQGCGNQAPPDTRPRCQELIIADTGNNRILKCVGDLCSHVAGTGLGSGDDQFNRPVSVAVDFDGDYLVSDYSNKRIMKCPSAVIGPCRQVDSTAGYTSSGPYKVTLLKEGLGAGGYVWTFQTSFRSSGAQVCAGDWACRGMSPDLIYQRGTATNADGDVLVVDDVNLMSCGSGTCGRVMKYVFSEGAPTFTATVSQVTPRAFQAPVNLAVDANGNYLVVDRSAHKVSRCPPDSLDGDCETVAGQHGLGSNLTQLNWPADVAVDVANRFYIADKLNSRILLCGETNGGVECIEVEGLVGEFALFEPEGVAVGNVVLCPELPNATASELSGAYFSAVV